MENCIYNLEAIPDGVVQRTEENRSDETVIKWSGPWPIPAIHERVNVAMNDFGPGYVAGYFVEYGYLGVRVEVDSPPEWWVKQHGLKGLAREKWPGLLFFWHRDRTSALRSQVIKSPG